VIKENLMSMITVLDTLGVSWELIAVNDGSGDETARVVEKLSHEEKGIRLLSYSSNRGRGYALRQGFRHASGRHLITTEADLSWGAGIIADLYHPLVEREDDVVVASPYLPGGKLLNVPWKRHLLSWLGNKVICFSLGGAVTMASGMTRGYRREILRGLDLESDGKEIHLEIISKILALGGKVSEIPARLEWDEPGGEEQVRRSTFKMRFILTHLMFSFEEYPLLLFGIVGSALFAGGLLLGGWAFIQSLRGVAMGGRPVTLAAILFLLFGLQVMVSAFLALQSRKQSKRIIRLTALVKSLKKDDGGRG
jgi:dolichol-phosphate mannosyltransferase